MKYYHHQHILEWGVISVKIIREGVFETNSSSTNTLVIDSDSNIIIPEKLYVCDNDWCGRNFEYTTPSEKFTVMVRVCYDKEELLGLCYKMYKAGVKEIVLPNPSTFTGLTDTKNIGIHCGEIDDSEGELRSLLEDENEQELVAFIFGSNSFIEGEDDNF